MGFPGLTFGLLLSVLGLLYYYIRRKYGYWADRNVTHIPGSLPFGSFKEMGSTKHITEILEGIYRRYKKTHVAVGIYLGVRPGLLVHDLDLIKQILVKDFNNFRDRGMFYNERDDPLSAHLFSIEGERWRFLRNKLSPTFTSGKIKYMFRTIREIGEEFLASFDSYAERRQPVDVAVLAQQFTCDVIGSCAFGLKCNALKNESAFLLEIGDRIFNPKPLEMFWIMLLVSFREWSVKLRLKQTPADVSAYFTDVVQKTVDYRERNNVSRPDFLQLLMQLKNRGTVEEDEEASGETITMNEVIAQAFLFFFAGFETSSRALSFALFELSHNSVVQDKAREEVQRVIAAHKGQITYEAIKEMTYLEQIVNETLRKHAPIGNLIRVANEPFLIPSLNATIENDTLVMIPVHAVHHDPDIYPDPLRFDPDRFTPEAIASRHSHSFLPFGDGPRMCIGTRFALVEVQFGIAQLLSRLRFSVNPRTELPLRYDPKANVAKAIGGLWLDVERI